MGFNWGRGKVLLGGGIWGVSRSLGERWASIGEGAGFFCLEERWASIGEGSMFSWEVAFGGGHVLLGRGGLQLGKGQGSFVVRRGGLQLGKGQGSLGRWHLGGGHVLLGRGGLQLGKGQGSLGREGGDLPFFLQEWEIPKDEEWLKLGGDKRGGSFKMSFQLGSTAKPNSVENTCFLRVQCLRHPYQPAHCSGKVQRPDFRPG